MKERYQKIIDRSQEHDFEAYTKHASHPREKMRFLAFVHLQNGKSAIEAAELVLTTRQSIYEWLRKFEHQGLDGLREQEGRGRKLALPVSEREAFKQAVLKLQNDREGGVINGKDVLDMMEKEFGVKCTQRSVYNHLKAAKLVWISSRSKHPRVDFEKQDSFKKILEKKS